MPQHALHCKSDDVTNTSVDFLVHLPPLKRMNLECDHFFSGIVVLASDGISLIIFFLPDFGLTPAYFCGTVSASDGNLTLALQQELLLEPRRYRLVTMECSYVGPAFSLEITSEVF